MSHSTDIVEHFLSGGKDPHVIRREMLEACERGARPLLPLPVVAASIGELQMLVAIARGPQWRCTRCGYLQPYDWRKPWHHDKQRVCRDGAPCHWNRFHKHHRRLLPQYDGPERVWYFETATICGVEVRVGENAIGEARADNASPLHDQTL